MIPTGKKSPEIVNAIIEIPKDSSVKYEIDKETGLIMLDRFLYSAVYYPGDYGFIPKTLCEDKDPLDVIILTQRALLPKTLAEVRVVGMMKMIDSGEKDDKIIAVYEKDPRHEHIKELKDIPEHILKEIRNFFETYKILQGKKCEVTGIFGKKEAYKCIRDSQKIYKEKFSDKE